MYTLAIRPMKVAPLNKLPLRIILFLVVITLLCVALRLKQTTRASRFDAKTETAASLERLPRTFLWAWERPEKLDFIDPRAIGVAFLAKTINLRDDRVAIRPRLQTLVLAPDTKVIAVVRIEVEKAALSQEQLEKVVKGVVETAQLPRLAAIQIDFDAKLSERDFYRQLLSKVRQQLPQDMPLSITALASWCAGDKWLSELPVDEAVPMMFRLGVDRNSRFSSGTGFSNYPCDSAAGVSTDELITPPTRNRLYIFSPERWTPQSVNAALETYAR